MVTGQFPWECKIPWLDLNLQSLFNFWYSDHRFRFPFFMSVTLKQMMIFLVKNSCTVTRFFSKMGGSFYDDVSGEKIPISFKAHCVQIPWSSLHGWITFPFCWIEYKRRTSNFELWWITYHRTQIPPYNFLHQISEIESVSLIFYSANIEFLKMARFFWEGL